MGDLGKITKNGYVSSNIGTYIINKENIDIRDSIAKKNKNFFIDFDNNEISLTPSSSNNYLLKDEAAHCDEKWQDWFCIPNYHNNNKVSLSPNTESMSVGVCYKPCKIGYTVSKIDKCNMYAPDDDLLYNPLAIIAIIGTHFNIYPEFVLPKKYNNIKETIGIRGSYLNDLYRVNNNDKFIKEEYINGKNPPSPYTTQEKFLIKIIDSFVNKGIYISTINEIHMDVQNTFTEFITIYKIDKFKNNEENEIKFMDKIKYYNFDIDVLETLYGVDKNKKKKFANIIAYVYNIMRLVLYDETNKLLDENEILYNIESLINMKVNKKYDFDTIKNIVLIFKRACYNCFNHNFDLFNNYLKNNLDKQIILLQKGIIPIEFDKNYLKKCNVNIDKNYEKPSNLQYIIYSYNNIKFYDHQLLSEYSENTKYIIQILIIFAIFFLIILFICAIYYVLMKYEINGHKIIHGFTHYINYILLFYKWITFNVILIMCSFYYIICRLGRYKFNIWCIFINFVNICILILLFGNLFLAILDLFNIDYIMLFVGNDWELYIKIFLWIINIYIILIYIYSAYILRYSLNSSEFDIISNYDADDTIAGNYFNNLMLSTYTSNMLSNYNSIYTVLELVNAKNILINQIPPVDLNLLIKKPEKEPEEEESLPTNSIPIASPTDPIIISAIPALSALSAIPALSALSTLSTLPPADYPPNNHPPPHPPHLIGTA